MCTNINLNIYMYTCLHLYICMFSYIYEYTPPNMCICSRIHITITYILEILLYF